MKLSWADGFIALWALLAGAWFVVPPVFCAQGMELELVGRYVYLVVVTISVIGIAFRAIGVIKRT